MERSRRRIRMAKFTQEKPKYDTTSYRPTTQPATKSITPNVKITVTWNNGGGVDVYYGYVSYSQRLALTDGIAVTDGVKEVWLS